MKQAKAKTTTQQLTYLFVSLFGTILILVNITFLIISSGYIYYQADQQSEQVIDAIKQNLHSKYDWSELLDLYLAKQDDDAITLTTPQGRTYYSEDAHEAFNHIQQQRHYKNMVYSNKHIYFLKTEKENGFQINVALNIDKLFHLIIWLFCTMLVINLLAIIISIPLIRRFSHKWSRPIQTMNTEIQTIQKNEPTQKEITVPTNPLEIKRLAQSFNSLLAFQNKALAREHQFVSDASHELKTPIAAIRGHVNLIKRHGQAKPINLIPIVKEVIAEIHTVYPQSIHTKLPDQLNFAIQENDFRKIVHNLVENAAKYSPADSAIKVTLAKQNDQLLLEVADHGQGIALQNREKIFDRFYREDQAHSSKIKGSGLGLAIVKAEVDKYHGQIKVTDNLPQGTIFTVVLPIEK